MTSYSLRFSLAISLTAFVALPQMVHAGRSAAQVTAEAEAAAAKEDVIPKDAPPPPAYVLKNRSAFNNPGETARVPFWPIGWIKGKPVGPVTVAQQPTTTISESAFRITSILISTGTTPSLAVINGRAYSEGELIRFPKGSQPIKIRVARINDGNVILEHDNQQLTVPLRRPELRQHADEDAVLGSDR